MKTEGWVISKDRQYFGKGDKGMAFGRMDNAEIFPTEGEAWKMAPAGSTVERARKGVFLIVRRSTRETMAVFAAPCCRDASLIQPEGGPVLSKWCTDNKMDADDYRLEYACVMEMKL